MAKVHENNRRWRDRFSDALCGWIPAFCPSFLVLGFYGFLRFLHRIFGRRYKKQQEANRQAFSGHRESVRAGGGYVEDQGSYEDIRYGAVTAAYAGCEVFAVYNALYALEGVHDPELPELFQTFSRDGMVLGGRFGTAPGAFKSFFKKRGYRFMCKTDPAYYDRMGEEWEVLLLVYYNDKRDIRRQIHTICITKENGRLTAHNVCRDTMEPGTFSNVTQLIRSLPGGHAEGIALYGIGR